MSDFKKGWYGTDDDNYWFFIGTNEDLTKYIMELDEFEEFAESVIQEDFNSMASGILCLLECAIAFTLENCHTHTKEDIYKMFLADYIESIYHDGDYPIFIDRCTGGTHQFRWANEEDDLEWE